jgi:hypothetical protein
VNLVNRTTVVILCLAVAIASIAIIALAWASPDSSISGLRDAVDWLQRHNQDSDKTLLSVALGALAFVAVIVALLELLPDGGSDVQVTDLQGANASLSTSDISGRVEEAVRQVEHVVAVKAALKSKKKGVLVALDLHVDPDANLALVTDEACNAARDLLANKIHVSVIEPVRARLHYRELRMKTKGRDLTPAPAETSEPAVVRLAQEPPSSPPSPPAPVVTDGPVQGTPA